MDETPAKSGLAPTSTDQVIALLGIYASQAGSYTTLLWQVPALSLTAQSFLLTIALSSGNGVGAKVIASLLSAVISAASYALMHDQRGHAINHGELAMRLSRLLELDQIINTELKVPDGVPGKTDANSLWTWQHEGTGFARPAGLMYAVWKGCMVLFLVVDAGILFSTVGSASIKVLILIALALMGLVTWLVHRSRGRRPASGR